FLAAPGTKPAAKKEGSVMQYLLPDTVVMGLRGHVVGVNFDEGYKNWRSVEHPPRSLIDAPVIKYPTEKAIVSLMQKSARHADRVTIATDYDTEGELIGKEAMELIRLVNPKVPIYRARFSAITKDEILKAVADAESLDLNLAAAGESRQVIDLVWGASLTRFLTIAARRGADGILSVGRVQSPTLAMIVDREREIEAFVPEKYWMLSLTGAKGKDTIEARHTHGRFTDKAEAEAAYAATLDPLTVTDIITGRKTDKAPAPLDTTTLIVGAGRLGISAASAMSRAEELYMRGFISYPRTDNTTYPKSLDVKEELKHFAGGAFAAEAAYVMKHLRAVPVRGKKETTDHPPIYPTGLASHEDIPDTVTWKLYEFVVRRFFATLCPDAEWETMKVNMTASAEPYTVTGGRLLVPGWRTVYPYSKAEENILPVFVKGEKLALTGKNIEEKETQPPARYTQSRLIQRMEELGLGTKSTRHEIISKLAGRKYIEGAATMRPTVIGRTVTESLQQYAGTITQPTMTKTLEEHMANIAAGTRTMDSVLSESRKMLSGIFDAMEMNAEAITEELIGCSREVERIGPCPVCGRPLVIRKKGTSQFIGCSGYPECSFNAGIPPALWGSAVKTSEVCAIHGVNHVQLLKKGAPPWKLGCPICSHIKTNTETFMMIPGMTEDMVHRLNRVHIYTIMDLLAGPADELASKLGMKTADILKMKDEGEKVIARLRRRTEMKKFISSMIPPRRGRSPSKVSGLLVGMGIGDIDALAKAPVEKLLEAKMSPAEAEKVQAEAKQVSHLAQMREFGVPAVTLKKYAAAGFADPMKFLSVHPAGLSLATGASVTTICSHQKLVAERLCRPAPEKISKAVFDAGTASLAGVADPEVLTSLALAGVYSAETLVKADSKTLAKVTGIDPKEITELKRAAKRRV
ncbi:MAG: DNA topoisomerase I, partial [Methanocorpusculum sp.]|nr:DNA topoisomerase I [Methanocorpusculum sp.]